MRLASAAGKVSYREGHAVGVQVVQDDPDHGGVGIGYIHQSPHLVGEVLYGAPFGHGHMAPARQRLTEQKEVAGASAAVLIVLASGASRLGRQRLPHIRQQLSGGLIEAHHRPAGVVGLGV